MRVDSISVYKIILPLEEPYYLSYKSIESLESVWVRIQLDDGKVGWGESTPLLGYSNSNLDDVWQKTTLLSESWIGRTILDILSESFNDLDGFLFASALTALEDASGVMQTQLGAIPVVGLVQERVDESPGDAINRVREFGYRTFKVKVGFASGYIDRNRLMAFQKELLPDERLRIDANQSLDEDSARALLSVCQENRVELFEQPLPIGDWDGCSQLARHSPVPIMLDESVTDIGSLEKIALTRAAKIVKLKLMKQGSMSALSLMVDRARSLGLEVVLGNGVAGWIDNLHEAAFWLRHLKDANLAGEMNGFLKIRGKVSQLGFGDGSVRILSSPEPIDKLLEHISLLDVRRYASVF
jgi:o-succinylbenzoate synthase